MGEPEHMPGALEHDLPDVGDAGHEFVREASADKMIVRRREHEGRHVDLVEPRSHVEVHDGQDPCGVGLAIRVREEEAAEVVGGMGLGGGPVVGARELRSVEPQGGVRPQRAE